MEQEETAVDAAYLRGFNSGYLLAQHEPDLATQLAANSNDQNPYFKGLLGGKQQYDKEVQEWAKSFGRGAPDRDAKAQQKER